MKKQHPATPLNREFLKQWRVIAEVLKIVIKREIKKGKTAHQATATAFKQVDVRGKLKKMVLANVIAAARKGLKA